jgi:hypothetical protein
MPFGLLIELRVLRPPPPVLMRGCLTGRVFRRDMKVAKIPSIATPVVTEMMMT